MATKTIKKFILPTPTEFIRYVGEAILLNTREDRDTQANFPPLVTRAKNLVLKKGLIEVEEEQQTK